MKISVSCKSVTLSLSVFIEFPAKMEAVFYWQNGRLVRFMMRARAKSNLILEQLCY